MADQFEQTAREVLDDWMCADGVRGQISLSERAEDALSLRVAGYARGVHAVVATAVREDRRARAAYEEAQGVLRAAADAHVAPEDLVAVRRRAVVAAREMYEARRQLDALLGLTP